MKDWKNFKDKEVIIGLLIIIILGFIAIFLLIRREIGYQKAEQPIVQAPYEENQDVLEVTIGEDDENFVMQDISEEAGSEKN